MIKKCFDRFGSKESKYIHRYYLPREFKKQVTFDEIGVLYCYDLLLYDHTPVPKKHFIHIDDIWAEIKVRYQHFHSFSDELKKEGIVYA